MLYYIQKIFLCKGRSVESNSDNIKQVKLRLDKFLKVSRLIKRRTVANEVSDLGRVLVNGNVAKPSKQLKEGDIIKIESTKRPIEIRILKIPQGNISIQEASSLYEILVNY